jgi:hypothetical protein
VILAQSGAVRQLPVADVIAQMSIDHGLDSQQLPAQEVSMASTAALAGNRSLLNR